MAPEGGSSFRQKTRFARFTNVPEMLRRWHVSADIKTAEDLKLPVPALAQRPADGQRAPETVISPALRRPARRHGRAGRPGRRDPQPGGAARKRTTCSRSACDGRKAALDLRLLGLPMTVPGKIDAAADRIADLWHAHRDDIYPGPDGQDAPVRGSLQLVFCDLGTPGDGWNVYDELRDQLAARGMPREPIRFIHDAKTDRDKGELFAACRAGTVAVLIGSTEKMGVGTNVQARAIALHHLDCPWRPADVAQREGRILRQGNHNDRGPDPPLRHRTVLRRLHVADRRTQSPVHRPGHARPARRPRDRGHRRRRPVLQRGQGPGHRQPAAHGQGRSRRRADPPGTRRTRPPPQPARSATASPAPARASPALPRSPTTSTPRSPGGRTPAATASP